MNGPIERMLGNNGDLANSVEQLANLTNRVQGQSIIDSDDIRNAKEMADNIGTIAGKISDVRAAIAATSAEASALSVNILSAFQDDNIDLAKDKLSAMFEVIQKLNQTGLNVSTQDLPAFLDLIEKAKTGINDLQTEMAASPNTESFKQASQALSELSDTIEKGDLQNKFNQASNAAETFASTLKTMPDILKTNELGFNKLNSDLADLSATTKATHKDFQDIYNTLGNNSVAKNIFESLNADATRLSETLTSLKQNAQAGSNQWSHPEGFGTSLSAIEKQLADMSSKKDQVLSSGADFGDVSKYFHNLVQLTDNVSTSVKSLQDVASKNVDMASSAGKELEAKIQELQSSSNSQFSKYSEEISSYLSKQLDSIQDAIDKGTSDSLAQLSSGRGLGSSFDGTMNHLGNSAAAAFQDSAVLDRMNSQQWFFNRSNANFEQAGRDASTVAGWQRTYSSDSYKAGALYSQAEKETNPEKRDALLKEANQRFMALTELQKRINEKAKSLGKAVTFMSEDDKKRLGREGKDFIKHIHQVLDDASKNSGNLISMAKAFDIKIDDDTLNSLSKGKSQINEMTDSIDKTNKSSQNLAKTLKNEVGGAIATLLSPLHSISRIMGMFGMAGMALTPLGIGMKAHEYYVEQGRDRYESMGVAASTGVMNGALSAEQAQQRLLSGNALYAASGGRIDRRAINQSFNSAMKQVGGGYGESPEAGMSDINSLVNKTALIQNVYGIDQGTMNDSYQTFYKDMRMSASDAADAIARVTQTAQASNVPVGKYLKMVTGLAQSFLKIGIGGEHAESIMANLMGRGMRAEVAQQTAQEAGSVMGNLAGNHSIMGFGASMLGMNPFDGMAQAAYTHEANGDPRKGWAGDVSKMIDSYANVYAGAYGSDPSVRRMGITDMFKGMGFSQQSASTLTSSYLQGNTDQFQEMFEKESNKMDNPNGALEEVNNKISEQLSQMHDTLSNSDKLKAEMDARLYNAANSLGGKIDNLIGKLAPLLMKLQEKMIELTFTIANLISKFFDSKLFSKVVAPAAGFAMDHLGGIAAGYAGYRVLKAAGKHIHAPTVRGAKGILKSGGKSLAKVGLTLAAIGGLGYLAESAFSGSSDSGKGKSSNVFDNIYDVLEKMLNFMTTGKAEAAAANGNGSSGFGRDALTNVLLPGAIGAAGLYASSSGMGGMFGGSGGSSSKSSESIKKDIKQNQKTLQSLKDENKKLQSQVNTATGNAKKEINKQIDKNNKAISTTQSKIDKSTKMLDKNAVQRHGKLTNHVTNAKNTVTGHVSKVGNGISNFINKIGGGLFKLSAKNGGMLSKVFGWVSGIAEKLSIGGLAAGAKRLAGGAVGGLLDAGLGILGHAVGGDFVKEDIGNAIGNNLIPMAAGAAGSLFGPMGSMVGYTLGSAINDNEHVKNNMQYLMGLVGVSDEQTEAARKAKYGGGDSADSGSDTDGGDQDDFGLGKPTFETNSALDNDQKDVLRGIHDDNLDTLKAINQSISDSGSGSGSEESGENGGGTSKDADNDNKERKEDASRKEASNSNASKVVTQAKKEEKLSTARNKQIAAFMDLEKVLLGKFQASVKEEHGNLWKKMDIIESVLIDINHNLVTAGKKIGSGGNAGKGAGHAAGVEFMKRLMAAGYSKEQAAAIAGNVEQESKFNAEAGKGGAHQGIAQWDAGRWRKLVEWAHGEGRNEWDRGTQEDFMIKELADYGLSPDGLSKDAHEATDQVNKGYERSGEATDKYRWGYAQGWLGDSLSGGGSGGEVNKEIMKNSRSWDDTEHTDYTRLRPESVNGLNSFAQAYADAHDGEQITLTGAAEQGNGHQGGEYSHANGWKTDVVVGDTDWALNWLRNQGYSANFEGDHIDIDYSGNDPRTGHAGGAGGAGGNDYWINNDKASYDNAVPMSSGAGLINNMPYETNKEIDEIGPSGGSQTNGQQQASQAQSKVQENLMKGLAPNGRAYDQNDIDFLTNNGYSIDAAKELLATDAKYSSTTVGNNSAESDLMRPMSGQFAQYGIIKHHFSGADSYWGTSPGAGTSGYAIMKGVQAMGGGNNGRSFRQMQQLARKQLMAMGGIPGHSANGSLSSSMTGEDIYSHVKSLNAQVDTSKLDASDMNASSAIDAAQLADTPEDKKAKQLDLNITIDADERDEFVKKLLPELQEAVQRVGARVNKIETVATQTAHAATASLNSNVSNIMHLKNTESGG